MSCELYGTAQFEFLPGDGYVVVGASLQNCCNTLVTFADYYLRANIEFRNKACTRGKYYSYTKLYFVLFVFIYVYSHMYVRHVLAVALASLP